MIAIREFTDPTCPWAFSAEPTLWRLRWLYGDQLRFERRMIVLTERGDEYVARGFDPPAQAVAMEAIQRTYGMPIVFDEAPRMLATVVPCRAVVATRLNSPQHETALLRGLRILRMAGELVDEAGVVAAAATAVGLDAAALATWMADPATEAAVREDMNLARSPSPAALVMDHKLATASDGRRRYTAPSLELTGPDERRIDIAGFNPTIAYEHAIANLAPELPRRDNPVSVDEVLAWAGEPLATVEVAEVMNQASDVVRAALNTSGATFAQVGPDGYWTRG